MQAAGHGHIVFTCMKSPHACVNKNAAVPIAAVATESDGKSESGTICGNK